MGKYFFQNESVYWQKDNQFGVVSKETFAQESYPKDDSVQILINDVEYATVPVSDIDLHRIDEIVSAKFDINQVVQAEKVANMKYQGMAATKARIAEIYGLFKRDSVKTFIPYPVALRSFIKSKGFVSNADVFFVIDDLQDRFILTIFWENSIVETREIPKKETDKIAEEVVRSQKNFISDHVKIITNPSFVCLSNNEDLCKAMSAIPGQKKESILYFNELYPAFVALESSVFNVRFNLADEVLMQKRMREFKRNLVSCGVAGGMIAVSLICFIFAFFQERILENKNVALNASYPVLVEKVKARNTLVYKDILAKREKVDLFGLYEDFLRNIPPGYSVGEFSLVLKNSDDLSGTWVFDAYVLSSGGIESQFGTKGLFKDRQVQNVFGKDLPAQEVELVLKKRKEIN